MMPPAEHPVIARARAHADRVAIVDAEGAWTYAHLLHRSSMLAAALLDGRNEVAGGRVLLLASAGIDFAAALWAVWRSGGIAVPLSPGQTPAEWAQIADDARPEAAVVSPEFAARFADVERGRQVRVVSPFAAGRLPAHDPDPDPDRAALMLYTSGTTSRPKGVVLTHGNLRAQIECLVEAWAWTDADRIPLVLPLNHVHGLVNILSCALWSGATCEMFRAFDPAQVWERIASGGATVFMAVPTVYFRLIAAWQAAPGDVQEAWSAGARRLRLMVSGSAALPVRVLECWRDITGHTLLERYGMTETGMILSNPLSGERRPGSVGVPLPGVEVRLLDEHGAGIAEGEPGELHVRSASVFREYWGRPEQTSAAFRDGGWFRTGDVAVVERSMYRLLGRLSVDIIKTGGEKVSALEIEEVIREHPTVADCAVVGVPDPEWGERVSAAVVLNPGAALALGELQAWARARLGGPRLPRRLLVVEALPRNALGKVAKPAVARLFETG